jgi:hypothetical protein
MIFEIIVSVTVNDTKISQMLETYCKLDLGFSLLIATICKYNEGKILHLKIVQQCK